MDRHHYVIRWSDAAGEHSTWYASSSGAIAGAVVLSERGIVFRVACEIPTVEDSYRHETITSRYPRPA